MATRSTIAVEHNDGTISSVYSHWNGYPSWNGKVLIDNYNSLAIAEKLVALGSISSLAERLEPTHEEVHTFDNPVKGVTVFYHRDRGEELSVYHFADMEAYRRDNDDEDYNYLFTNGNWYLDGDRDLILVKTVIDEEED